MGFTFKEEVCLAGTLQHVHDLIEGERLIGLFV